MPRRFITKQDIDACADKGTDVIEIDDRVTVTDAAREHARERGVRLERVAGAVADGPSTQGGSPPTAGAVRAAVIAQLGAAPDDLDAVIRAVLDRHTGRADDR
jgi:hypothetical protein